VNINVALSLELADDPFVEKKHCFRNCLLLQTTFGEDWLYCEGYAAPHNLSFPVEHAWLEVAGEIVDPTWADDDMAKNVYVATQKYTPEAVNTLMDASADNTLHSPLCIRHAEDRGAASHAHHFVTFMAAIAAVKERGQS